MSAMTIIPVTIEAIHNNRVVSGLLSVEDLRTTEDFQVFSHPGNQDSVVVTLGIDQGRYDSEGHSYLCDLLNVLPDDIIFSFVQ